MRRFLVLGLLTALAFVAGNYLFHRLAPAESRIRWLLDDGIAAFNAGRPGSAVEPLADDWWDRTSGIHKDTLHQLLAGMMFSERGGRDRSLLWRLELREESLAIEVAADDTATAAFELALSRRRGEAWTEEWRIAVAAELREGGGAWEVFRTAHTTLEGKRP